MATAVVEMKLVQMLGGRAALGRHVRSQEELIEAIREGLPVGSAAALAERIGLNQTETAQALGMAPRTFHRRLAAKRRLTPGESDRAVRLAQVFAEATEVLGAEEGAAHWLRQPNRALRGATPLAELDTEPGTLEVKAVLGRIAYGGYS